MKFLYVGLGNPGSKYENTRHNIGFKVVDALVKEGEGTYEDEKYGQLALVKFKGRQLYCLKPNTFMNLSGKAVNFWMQQLKVSLENVVVITDDLALPFGKLRMKGKGSDGGHNGLADIQQTLKTSQYARLRFGVGNDFARGRQVDYVLGEWSADEEAAMPERIDTACQFLKSFPMLGLAKTMSDWNNK